jgi:hypothetical protein
VLDVRGARGAYRAKLGPCFLDLLPRAIARRLDSFFREHGRSRVHRGLELLRKRPTPAASGRSSRCSRRRGAHALGLGAARDDDARRVALRQVATCTGAGGWLVQAARARSRPRRGGGARERSGRPEVAPAVRDRRGARRRRPRGSSAARVAGLTSRAEPALALRRTAASAPTATSGGQLPLEDEPTDDANGDFTWGIGVSRDDPPRARSASRGLPARATSCHSATPGKASPAQCSPSTPAPGTCATPRRAVARRISLGKRRSSQRLRTIPPEVASRTSTAVGAARGRLCSASDLAPFQARRSAAT